MNGLFTVGAKLLGLSQLLLSFSLSFNLLAQVTSRREGSLGLSMVILLSFAFALVLLFRTDWLASAVGATGPLDLGALSPRLLLKVGIVLVGLAAFLRGVPQVVELAWFAAGNPLFQGNVLNWRLISQVAPTVLSLLLIFGSERAVRMLEKSGTTAS